MNTPKVIFSRAMNILALPVIWLNIHGSIRSRVLITTGNKLLVVRGFITGYRWDLPGGGKHKDEPIVDCAIRETREETGIKLNPSQLSLVGSLLVTKFNLNIKLEFFRVQLTDEVETIPQPLEISQIEWIDISELNSGNTAPELLYAIQKFVR
jgi:8-oxo-dGTP pyrophosphatase MutT (NUDIX family)